ncbi:spermidine synthase / spermine synthase [Pyrobaculum islandicum DSM 4184]|uniref:Polyamine aminopropyltransferase n=1 Tax=Pyrobaculum islandicum (strain DSM 4184 / JCM 9189 / GEO3) TaxID=384616 RepID=SPEE_PYRIL|nr:polyamine aminopropyltransferase [Pyrobaculum islandicum]A1RU43.1 RecName: Full=Polyamine aminopropyltransferase; AltName: Full=Putrescine aminopropyltransferase; Short=PAPT; AltName: Full=Spermidine synthase; Short=SPDS; Short=SPDSY [Pyrobaculum islandicum DSM 4184]ABL88475.1 spermidine synthase / spermine synthase [Pyrobaculum islandicum DSM 4184]
MVSVPGPVSLIEPLSGNTILVIKINALHVVKRSKYQEIIIADTEDFGRALILDEYIQSSYYDEAYYHESLVHPAMVTHISPRDVLILGGGEGATLREALKHSTVKRAVMVDIDEDVVELSKKYLPQMHQGVFEDPRAQVVIEDGFVYVEKALKNGDKFDVVIMDLTDPYSSEIAKQLYSPEFFKKLVGLLREDGIIVTQAGNSFFFPEAYDMVLHGVKSSFPVVAEYNVWIPSFGYAVNYIIGSLKYDPTSLTAEEVEKRLKERGVKTLFYSGKTHVGLMNLPIYRKIRHV